MLQSRKVLSLIIAVGYLLLRTALMPRIRRTQLDFHEPFRPQRDEEVVVENAQALAAIFSKYSFPLEKSSAIVRSVLGRDIEAYALGEKRVDAKTLDRIDRALSAGDVSSSSQPAPGKRKTEYGYVDEEPGYVQLKARDMRRWLDRMRKTHGKNKTHEQEEQEFYQGLALTAAYASWNSGDILEIPMEVDKGDQAIHYVCLKQITTKEGLSMTVFKPSSKGQPHYPPLVLFRGTRQLWGERTVLDISNLKDDFSKEIGSTSFNAARHMIAEQLQKLADNHGPALLIGHSLGGAVAQRVVADNMSHFCGEKGNLRSVIRGAYLYNAPGVGKAAQRMFETKRKQLERQGIEVPDTVDIFHARDLVHRVGRGHVCTRRVQLGSSSHPIGKHVKAHFFAGKPLHRFRKTKFKLSRWTRVKNRLLDKVRRVARLLVAGSIEQAIREREVRIFMDRVNHA